MTNRDVIAAWDEHSRTHTPFGPQGDFAREHLLNPAVFTLLGPPAGLRVLDAGCGGGYLSRLLARAGAHVTGLEPSAYIAQARAAEAAEPLDIRYVQADLSAGFGDDGVYDAVIANMVLQDIPDYGAAMRHCAAALRRGGRLIFSLVHPCFEEPDAAWAAKGYVAVAEYLREHSQPQAGGPPLFHRPLSAYLNLVVEAGCAIRRILEPRLDDPADRNAHVPSFIVVLAERG